MLIKQMNYGKSESKVFNWRFYLKAVSGESHHKEFLNSFTTEFLSTIGNYWKLFSFWQK